MTGLDLQEKLIEMGSSLPVIFITGHGDIPMAVEAMRRGAVDFIRKPFREHDLLDRINEALTVSDETRRRIMDRQALDEKLCFLVDQGVGGLRTRCRWRYEQSYRRGPWY